MLTTLTVLSLNDANSSRKGHPDPQKVQISNLSHDFLAQIYSVLQRRRGEDFVHDDDAVRGRMVEDLANPNEIVVQLAAEIRDVLFAFEMCEKAVVEK